ncbi:uncharacterized protein LOC109841625 [Asparagus officinalis]|uniref:uncharacterized protein LOC109841625 n=1 Tax=Asparagus officinalis TaxID=4686 RepID=UPI00098E49D8|nr:uncharacterized protein LOC109841625 [Asparagus officinalis]
MGFERPGFASGAPNVGDDGLEGGGCLVGLEEFVWFSRGRDCGDEGGFGVVDGGLGEYSGCQRGRREGAGAEEGAVEEGGTGRGSGVASEFGPRIDKMEGPRPSRSVMDGLGPRQTPAALEEGYAVVKKQSFRRGAPASSTPATNPALDLDQIQSNSVRLLDQEQSMVGVMSLDEAVQMADGSEIVLAILSPGADPPVLRLFDSEDYKKHKFEQQKKKRVQRKRSLANRVDIKEVKMGYNIDSHDYSVRLRAAKRFLSDGDKVKVIVNLKRRENEFKDKAIELLKQFQNDLWELAKTRRARISV